FLARDVEIVDISGSLTSVSNLRWNPLMDASSPRHVGRPWQMAPYAPQVAQWLREDPNLSGAEILRRVRLAGYRGGKSAFYELVRRLRVGRPAEVTVAAESPRGPGPVQGVRHR